MEVKRSGVIFSKHHLAASVLHNRFDEGKSRLSNTWANAISRVREEVHNKKIAHVRKDHSLSWCPQYRVLCKLGPQAFLTDSQYSGEWDEFGMHGHGSYCLPHKVQYEGGLEDGMFHGKGILRYPMGQTIEGEWVKGRMVSHKFHFADNLAYYEPWDYCIMPDRRYLKSIRDGLKPAGRSLLTNDDVPRVIPEGCYDTGDGFYNPKTKCVTSAYDSSKIIRVPTAVEEKWIMDNCRKAWDEPTGYRPDYFQHWVSGRSTDSVFQPPVEINEEFDRPISSSSSSDSRQAASYINVKRHYFDL